MLTELYASPISAESSIALSICAFGLSIATMNVGPTILRAKLSYESIHDISIRTSAYIKEDEQYFI